MLILLNHNMVLKTVKGIPPVLFLLVSFKFCTGQYPWWFVFRQELRCIWQEGMGSEFIVVSSC